MVSLGVHRHYVPTDLQPNAVYHFRLRVHYRHVDPFSFSSIAKRPFGQTTYYVYNVYNHEL